MPLASMAYAPGFEIAQDAVRISKPCSTALKIFGARFERHFHQLIFVGSVAWDNDLALAMEKAADGTGGSNRATALVRMLRISDAVRLAVIGAQ